MHGEFGGRTRTVVHAHHHDVAHLLAVATQITADGIAECRGAGFTITLIDVMHDIRGQTIEHTVQIPTIERCEIAQYQGAGSVRCASAIDDHG